MGFRTVVVLNNDHNWFDNKNLADDIRVRSNTRFQELLPNKGIKVLEVEHADASTLMTISYYGKAKIFAKDENWKSDEDARNLRLLKEAAEQMGYRLVKKKV